jgi:hypothetical protein
LNFLIEGEETVKLALLLRWDLTSVHLMEELNHEQRNADAGNQFIPCLKGEEHAVGADS